MDKSYKNNIEQKKPGTEQYVLCLFIESYKIEKTNLFVRSQDNSDSQRLWW